MQVCSIFVAEGFTMMFNGNADLTEKEATFKGFAWSLFIVNTVAAILFLLLLTPNKKFFTVFKGKKASVGNTILWGFLGFILAMGGQMLAAAIEHAFGVKPGSENTALLADIAKTSPIVIISIVLFAPFLEEIIFRRVIFGGIYLKTNFWIAAVLSAVVFAAVHNELEHLLLYMMPALVFAYVYYRTKRLITPMISHLLMNGFVVIAQLNYEKLQRLQDMKQGIILFFN